jgi:hypothetical protein
MLQWLQRSNPFKKPADYHYDGANIFWCYVPRDFVTTISVLGSLRFLQLDDVSCDGSFDYRR